MQKIKLTFGHVLPNENVHISSNLKNGKIQRTNKMQFFFSKITQKTKLKITPEPRSIIISTCGGHLPDGSYNF